MFQVTVTDETQKQFELDFSTPSPDQDTADKVVDYTPKKRPLPDSTGSRTPRVAAAVRDTRRNYQVSAAGNIGKI